VQLAQARVVKAGTALGVQIFRSGAQAVQAAPVLRANEAAVQVFVHIGRAAVGQLQLFIKRAA
jgi:hypothetical protein